jgi:hypothetical protein
MFFTEGGESLEADKGVVNPSNKFRMSKAFVNMEK